MYLPLQYVKKRTWSSRGALMRMRARPPNNVLLCLQHASCFAYNMHRLYDTMPNGRYYSSSFTVFNPLSSWFEISGTRIKDRQLDLSQLRPMITASYTHNEQLPGSYCSKCPNMPKSITTPKVCLPIPMYYK